MCNRLYFTVKKKELKEKQVKTGGGGGDLGGKTVKVDVYSPNSSKHFKNCIEEKHSKDKIMIGKKYFYTGNHRYLQLIRPGFVVELFLHHYYQPMGALLLLKVFNNKGKRKTVYKGYNAICGLKE